MTNAAPSGRKNPVSFMLTGFFQPASMAFTGQESAAS